MGRARTAAAVPQPQHQQQQPQQQEQEQEQEQEPDTNKAKVGLECTRQPIILEPQNLQGVTGAEGLMDPETESGRFFAHFWGSLYRVARCAESHHERSAA